MPWVCPMCSTNNEDSVSKCIVCEHERVLDRICTLTYLKVQKLGLGGHVVVPSEFNVIGEGAFRGRTDIYSVTLHENVRKIAKEAFSGCSNLKSVVCRGELESIGSKAFAECVALPIAARVKARYVSGDAYHITPKPITTSSYTKSSTASSYTTTTSTYTDHEEPKPTKAKTHATRPGCLGIVARTILLGLVLFVLTPIVYTFVASFHSGFDRGMGTLIGLALSFLFAAVVIAQHGNRERKEFVKKNKLFPILGLQLLSFVLWVLWPEGLKWINVFLCAPWILMEFLCFAKAKYQRMTRFVVITVCMMITNALLLWRIFAA